MISYLLPFVSVLLGYGIAFILKPKEKKTLKLLLAFSGSFLLSLTVIHLLPEVYKSNNTSIGLFIMIGILVQIVLEFFSQGAEHGHVHGHHKISHIPWALFISLCIHAFLEGFPVSHHPNLALGIAIHHLPIAIILTTFFINAALQKKALFLFMLTFAVMTPMGTLLADYLPILRQYYPQIAGIVIGILFHISSTIIFESNENHKFNLTKISMIILGVLLASII